MTVGDYYHNVFVPANVAVSSLRRAGMPVDRARLDALAARWTARLAELERQVEGTAASRGIALKYSAAHAPPQGPLLDLLYSPRGLGLEVKGTTPTGRPSTDDTYLSWYASVAHPRGAGTPADDDDLVWDTVWSVLKIRSLSRALSVNVDSFRRTQRADGCVHAKYNWAKVRTPRLSAEDPPVHQIPEHSDAEVADGVKSCIVPRVSPSRSPEEWDPRRHGSCFRWDIAGAEAAIRAACLTARFCHRPDPVAWEYIRLGKDIHGKTASLIYDAPDGTYRKGMLERDTVGKQSFFAKLFGAAWRTVQETVWKRARIWLPDEKARDIDGRFAAGYPGLAELHELDKDKLGRLGYCEDGYGRRRWVGLPDGVRYEGLCAGAARFVVDGRGGEWKRRNGDLQHRCHVQANTPTQGMNGTDNLWMIALCYHGEYVDLAVPPIWEADGVLFPEAAGWAFHGGPGPGGRPFQAWHSNTVHDSGWGDCAPGWLEPTAKVIWRRCQALPMDWRLEADVPYRVELKVGPDQGHLRDYNVVAKEFGLEPLPVR